MSTLTTYFIIVLEVLATAIRQEKEMKEIQTNKKEVKFSLFANDMILHIENQKDPTKKLLELINSVKSQDTKSTYSNLLHFYIPIMKQQKEKLRNQPPLTIAPKRIRYLGINLRR